MAAKLGFEIVKQAMLKLLMKKGDDGIVLTLPKNEILDLNTRITMDRLIRNNIDPNSLTSPDQVINVLDNINNQTLKNAIPADTAQGKKITEMLFGKKGEVVDMTGKKIDTSQGIMGGKSVKELMESGQVQKGTDNIKISEKITDREMFKNSNLNKKDSVTETVSYIKTLEPMDAMKEANSVIGRKGKYKNLTPEESKKILTDTEDHIFERDIPVDPEDMAKGGRAGFYTGGITDVEPSLDDIGHGADAMMSRTRLMSPGSQTTTSTGLNYLLAEDNDNMRIPFAGGGGGRRAFLKMLGLTGAGIAGLKSGMIGLGKGGGKQLTKEVAKEVATGSPPPYFLRLVEKIKFMGDDALATQDKAIAKKYKDYTMEEDFAGNIEIIKKGDNVAEDVYISYKVDDVPLRGKKGSKRIEEYEEYTARPDAEGKMKDIEQGVPDEVIDEAGDTTAMTLKRASGGIARMLGE